MTHLVPLHIRIDNASRARNKLALCLRNAKDASREAWNPENSKAHRREYKRLRAESMSDARYWRDVIEDNPEDVA